MNYYGVSILVLVDVALRQQEQGMEYPATHVSILVLVDVALRQSLITIFP